MAVHERENKKTAGAAKTVAGPAMSAAGRTDGGRLTDAAAAQAVGNSAMAGFISKRVLRENKNAGEAHADAGLYDADVLNNLTSMKYDRKGLMSNYRPSKRELRDNTVPRQFFRLSTLKGNFFVGKRRGKDEMVMTSVLNNARGQNVKRNEQRVFDSTGTRERRIGDQKINKPNNALDDGAVAVSAEGKNIGNIRRLVKNLGKTIYGGNRLGSLEKTVPFLRTDKETRAIEALTKRMEQLNGADKRLETTDPRESEKEKQAINIKLQKCRSALAAKERMQTAFVKKLGEASDYFEEGRGRTADEDERVRAAAELILLNNMYDGADGEEDEEGKDKRSPSAKKRPRKSPAKKTGDLTEH